MRNLFFERICPVLGSIYFFSGGLIDNSVLFLAYFFTPFVALCIYGWITIWQRDKHSKKRDAERLKGCTQCL